MIKLIKDSFAHFLDSDPFQEGAALAYYTMFSLIPVIIIIISFLDLFFSQQTVTGEVFNLFKDFIRGGRCSSNTKHNQGPTFQSQ